MRHVLSVAFLLSGVLMSQQTVVTKDLGPDPSWTPIPAGAPPGTPIATSTRITWTLQGTWTKGQFVNGDWWVVVPIGQTAQVLSTTFASDPPNAIPPVPYSYGPLITIGVGGPAHHAVRSGSMKNPRATEQISPMSLPNIYQALYNNTTNPNLPYWWLNNPFGTNPTYAGPSPLGYDSRSGYFYPDFALDFRPGSPAVTVAPWDVVVTTISYPDAGNRPDYDPEYWTVPATNPIWPTNFDTTGQDGRSPTRFASVLTVLPEVPPGTFFPPGVDAGQCLYLRPPYGGPAALRATLSGGSLTAPQPSGYLARWQWNPTAFMQRTPSVQRGSIVTSPVAQDLLTFWRGTFLDHLTHEQSSRYLAPSSAVPTYGGDQNAMIGATALMLCESPTAPGYANPQMSVQDKEDLMKVFLQFGIDTYGLAQDGRRFVGGGGHTGGRKWPVLYAGIVMNDAPMRIAGGNVVIPPTNKFCWKEDVQCTTESASGQFVPDWQGLLYRWRSTNEFSFATTIYQNNPPSAWQQDEVDAERYRSCCTFGAYIYTDLACRLMNNHPAVFPLRAMELWGNDAFFGCVDRFMIPMTPEACHEYDIVTLASVSFHYSKWGESYAVTGPHQYGQRMWRALRWQNHQQGVTLLGPAAFPGAEHDCGPTSGPQLLTPPPNSVRALRCRDSSPNSSEMSNPAPRSLPVLVTQQRPQINTNTRMYFEVYGVPRDSVLVFYVAATSYSANPVYWNPGMSCSCVAPTVVTLCNAPIFVDTSEVYESASFNTNMNNGAFSFLVPSGLITFGVQAVMAEPGFNNWVSSNAYLVNTFH